MRQEPSRLVWPPSPGTFKLRLVRGGPWVPAEIVHLDGMWQAVIAGEPRRPHADPVLADGVERVWSWAVAIPRFEHDYLCAVA